MGKKVEFYVESDSKALDKAAQLLGLPEDKINLRQLGKKLENGVSLLHFEATSSINLALEGKNYLNGIFDAFNLKVQMEFRMVSDNEILFRVTSKENPLLIGKDGKNLLSIQHLLKQYLNTFAGSDENLLVNLDIGGYQENRKKQLEMLAVRTAKEVIKSKISVKLDPMSPYDRLIIHNRLSDFEGISSDSTGTGEDRAIVISYKK
ncbi:MAG: hypothetical protein LBV51_05840 [Acholeplasmatales bacterium]|jgi:spoIIIJ-associated protein|nr:hypothetical protein [Acholeplasmatales bacterium]